MKRLGVGFALLFFALGARALDVVVEALLPGLAVLSIDGERVTLRSGETHRGLRLVAADARAALVEVDGVERRLAVSDRVSATFTRPEKASITVRRDSQLQYRTTAEINGVRLPVIVDTGANIVALNARQAAQVGIGEADGVATEIQTAGAVMTARRVTLDSVSVGGIRIDAVAATVIDGPHPPVALLGMSFLQHVEMRERDGVLTLSGRW